MRDTVRAVLLALASIAAFGQSPGKLEFDAASIKPKAQEPGFHFAAESESGGPGTSDPTLFRCSQCSLTTLILKAFQIQPYQFPDRKSYTANAYDVVAKVPAGASSEGFSAMLQNLLADRFGLASHFQDKKLKGYRLIIARNGPKLKESAAGPTPPAAGTHRHSGVMAFGTSASYRVAGQTTAGLARILSDQIGLPVDDGTGLQGNYDIVLTWTGSPSGHFGDHDTGAHSGGANVGHDVSAGGSLWGQSSDSSAPALFDALQQQLGLRLVPAPEVIARIFIIDRVASRPTDN